jgi:hypothetical protein
MSEGPGGFTAHRKTRTTVVFETADVSGDPGRPDRVEIRFDRKLSGRPVSITVSAQDGLRPSDMRRLPWSTWFRFADVAVREMQPDEHGDVVLTEASVAFHDAPNASRPTRRRPGRRGHPDQHYQDIARRYRELLSTGARNPTHRIAQENDVPRDTAAGWLAGARTRGYLPPARQGRAG